MRAGRALFPSAIPSAAPCPVLSPRRYAHTPIALAQPPKFSIATSPGAETVLYIRPACTSHPSVRAPSNRGRTRGPSERRVSGYDGRTNVSLSDSGRSGGGPRQASGEDGFGPRGATFGGAPTVLGRGRSAIEQRVAEQRIAAQRRAAHFDSTWETFPPCRFRCLAAATDRYLGTYTHASRM